MFSVDPNLKHISASRGQVVSVIESINHPQVGVPGYSAQVSEATVVGVRKSSGAFSLFIHLHLTETGEAAVYSYRNRDLDIEAYPEVEQLAIEFVESMGFIMDDLNFRNLSSVQQDEIMGRLACFQPDVGQGAKASTEEAAPLPLEAEAAPTASSDFSEKAALIDDGGSSDLVRGLLEELEGLEPAEPPDGRRDDPSRLEVEAADDGDVAAASEVTRLTPDSATRIARLLASF